MQTIGRIIYWLLTACALVLVGFAAFEVGGAEIAKGNALMRAALFLIGAVALWSFGCAILRVMSGK